MTLVSSPKHLVGETMLRVYAADWTSATKTGSSPSEPTLVSAANVARMCGVPLARARAIGAAAANGGDVAAVAAELEVALAADGGEPEHVVLRQLAATYYAVCTYLDERIGQVLETLRQGCPILPYRLR